MTTSLRLLGAGGGDLSEHGAREEGGDGGGADESEGAVAQEAAAADGAARGKIAAVEVAAPVGACRGRVVPRCGSWRSSYGRKCGRVLAALELG